MLHALRVSLVNLSCLLSFSVYADPNPPNQNFQLQNSTENPCERDACIPDLDFLAKQFLQRLNWSNPYGLDSLKSELNSQELLKQVLVKTMQLIKEQANASNYERELKPKFSLLMQIVDQTFPDLKWNEYILNYGPNPPNPPEFAQDPRFLEQLNRTKYGVTLNEKGMFLLFKYGDRFFQTHSSGQTSIYPTKFAELANTLQKVLAWPSPKGVYLAVQDDKSMHVTLIAARHLQSVYEFVIIDSTGGTFHTQAPTGPTTESFFVQKYADLLNYSFGNLGPVKISYFSQKRQRDLLSCPVFVYRDFFTAKHISIFDYISNVESTFPDRLKIVELRGPGMWSSIVQGVPEHPSQLILAQNMQLLNELDRDFASYFIDVQRFQMQLNRNLGFDEKQKPINFGAQKELLELVYALLKHKVLGTELFL